MYLKKEEVSNGLFLITNKNSKTMKKSKTTLSLGKSTIVSLEKKAQQMIVGGFDSPQAPTDSCPGGGGNCASERNSCNLSCNGYPKCFN